jgi:class 3 adenylate cyclase/ActR/RegA family two-component response regulator
LIGTKPDGIVVRVLKPVMRTVTTLFTDLVDSTAQAAAVGQSAWEDVRARHFTGIRDAIGVHRGHEVKTLGDGFMAVFDGVSDALACAITMQRATVARSRRHLKRPLGLRVGISTGEVTVENDDYFGMPVVEAARLCGAARSGEVLATDIVKALLGRSSKHRLRPAGELNLKGIPEPVTAWSLDWDAAEDDVLRVVLADDSVLIREGVASLLEAAGMDVVAQLSDVTEVLKVVEETRAEVVVLDVRMPPSFTTEGLEAADAIRASHPNVGVLLLSAQLQAAAARRLLANGTDGIGYLLKDRVGDPEELANAVRTVARGGSAIDPEVIDEVSSVGDASAS